MSRSYRKPFTTHTVCNRSAQWDKRTASRAVRRANRLALKTCIDFEDFSAMHRYECNHNDVWSWQRDGKQHIVLEFDRDPNLHEIIVEVDWLTQVERVLDGQPAINEPTPRWDHAEWYKKVQRK
jgi:hypothetical protein